MAQPLLRPTEKTLTAEEICGLARRAVDSETPLLILVLYRHEADKQEFVTELRHTLDAADLKARIQDLATGRAEAERLYESLAAATDNEVSLVTRLLQAPGGLRLDTGFLEYLNLHRDRIQLERLRLVLFLHEADAEQFQRQAGDFWDFRQHTFWLDGEPAPQAEMVWLNVERALDASTRTVIPETREEIEAHCRRVREQVKRTKQRSERAALLGDLASWLLRRDAVEPAAAVALDALREAGEGVTVERADLEVVAAEALRRTGALGTAVEHLEQKVGIHRELGDRKSEAQALGGLAALYRQQGQLDEAEATLRMAIEIAETAKDHESLAGLWFQLAGLIQIRGRLAEALSGYRRALEFAEEAGNRAGMAASYHQLGIVAQSRGSYEDALGWYRKALEIPEAFGDRAGMAASCHQLGRVAQELGSSEEALGWYRKSLEIFEELGDRPGMATSYHQLGRMAEERGSYEEALGWYRKSLDIEEELGNRAGIASSYGQLALLAQERGDLDSAEEWTRMALELCEQLGDRAGVARAQSQLGGILHQRGETAQAVPLNLRSLATRLEIGSPKAPIDLHNLTLQREVLGGERFRELLTRHAGEERGEQVLKLMAEYEEARRQGEASAPGEGEGGG